MADHLLTKPEQMCMPILQIPSRPDSRGEDKEDTEMVKCNSFWEVLCFRCHLGLHREMPDKKQNSRDAEAVILCVSLKHWLNEFLEVAFS